MDSKRRTGKAPAGAPGEISEREYWQQEKEKAIWDLMIFFAAVVIVAIAVGTAAWFASNKEVSGSNMQVSLLDGDYEIWVTGENVGPAVIGENKTIYDFSPAIDYVRSLTDGTAATYNETAGYQTDSTNRQIKWRLTSGNAALGPDSQGVFTFYIVPKISGTLSAKFQIDLRGYNATQEITDGSYTITQDTLVPIASDADAVKYLNGHIQFFAGRQNRDGGGYTYTVRHEGEDCVLLRGEEGFTLECSNAVAGTPIEVNLYWIWANTFKQLVFTDGIGTQIPVAGNTTTQTMLQEFTSQHPDMLFMTEEEDHAADKVSATDSETGERVFSATNSITNMDDLSLYYNKADQLIGMNVDYVLVVLTAE